MGVAGGSGFTKASAFRARIIRMSEADRNHAVRDKTAGTDGFWTYVPPA